MDKPHGWTSFDVCGKLRSALKIKKVAPHPTHRVFTVAQGPDRQGTCPPWQATIAGCLGHSATGFHVA